MSETTRRSFIATLKETGQAKKGGKPVHTYQVLRPGMQYPDFITLWDERWDGAFPSLAVDTPYEWTVDAKPKGEGKKGEYLDFVSAEAPAQAARDAPTPKTAYEQRMDVARPSIEAQTALSAAKDLVVALLVADPKTHLDVGPILILRAYAAEAYAIIQALKDGRSATTPAEEIHGQEPDRSGHYCEEHKTNWIKIKDGYGHKIDNTGDWCNEPKPGAAVPSTPSAGQEPSPAPATPQAPSRPPARAQAPARGVVRDNRALPRQDPLYEEWKQVTKGSADEERALFVTQQFGKAGFGYLTPEEKRQAIDSWKQGMQPTTQ